MEIIDNRSKKQKRPLDEIQGGFEFNGQIYIKLSGYVSVCQIAFIKCLDVSNNAITELNQSTMVIPVNVKLIINDYES